jgi:hypothetical protein
MLKHQTYIHGRGGVVHGQQIDRVIQFPEKIHAEQGIFYMTIPVAVACRVNYLSTVNCSLRSIQTSTPKTLSTGTSG